uniref:Immunoglobulin I-set domain protein n=1 Tax=Heterorhabditis bacteriophora TaxID=37862 RepID=A0A1I7XHZ6_HETBA
MNSCSELAPPKIDVVREPPEFSELLKSCTVRMNEQSVLKCKVKGEPKPKIKWTKDGKEVEMSARIKIEFKDDGTLTLTIENTSQQDAGEYRCTAENEVGSAWTEGPIIIIAESIPQFDGEAPDFLEPVKPAVVYKNGEQLKKSDRLNIEDFEDGIQRLTVKNAQMEDMDEYRCEASNEYGDVWSDVTLTVKEKPPSAVAPTFIKTLVEVRVQEGEKVKYECQVMGQPEPEMKWYKDNKQISLEDAHFIQSLEANGIAQLVITSAEVKDSGEFRCEARNVAGVARTDAPLTVSENEILAEYAPEFLHDLTACEVNEGETAEFECKVSGVPLPTVRWFKNGEELKPDEGVSIVSTPDGLNKLTIAKAKTEDQGNYRAEAVNSAGSMSSKAPLSVHDKKLLLAVETLKIKKGLEDVTVHKGTKIRLSVEVIGQPKTVKWYKGAEQLSSNRNTSIEKVSDVEYKLEIDNAEICDSGLYRVVLSTDTQSVESSSTVAVTDQYPKVHLPSFKKGLNDQEVPKFKDSDVGEYSITAGNDAGEVESKAKITVKPSEVEKDSGKIEIVSGLIPTTVKQGETATFTVVTKGPVKNIKWYKNNKEIPAAKTKDNGEGTYELIIPDAQPDDADNYKVVLSNDIGEADSCAALSVKLHGIEILKGLKDVSVLEGQKAIFKILTNKLPKVVKWYKNGKQISPADKAHPEELGGNIYQLIIPDAKEDDVANYKVHLTDDDDNSAESFAALLVQLPKIEIVKGLKDIVIPKGQKAMLEIETSRQPKEVKWLVQYKNGKEILLGNKAEPKKLGDNNYLLEIPDIAEDDAAEYKVVLKDNSGNSTDSSCRLTIKLPAEEPKIIKGLDDQAIPIGAPIVLDIETLGCPTTVKWYKNGQLLPGGAASKIKINKINDNNFILEIPTSVLDDTGEYSVEVENEAGVATSTGKVTVEPKLIFLTPLKDQEIFEGEDAKFLVVLTNSTGDADSFAKLIVKKPKPAVPKIIKELEDQIIPEGEALIFEVKIDGEPTEVRWLKDAIPIVPGVNAVIEQIDQQTYRLKIPKAELKDAGYYTVEAMNETGKAKSNCKVDVDEKPEIVKGLNDIELLQNDDHVFKVEVSTPVRSVTW